MTFCRAFTVGFFPGISAASYLAWKVPISFLEELFMSTLSGLLFPAFFPQWLFLRAHSLGFPLAVSNDYFQCGGFFVALFLRAFSVRSFIASASVRFLAVAFFLRPVFRRGFPCAFFQQVLNCDLGKGFFVPSFTGAFIVGFLTSGCFGALFRRSSLYALFCKALFEVLFHKVFFCARFRRRFSSGLFSQGLFLRSFAAIFPCIHSGGSFPVRFLAGETSMVSFKGAYSVHFLAVVFLRALLCRAFLPCPFVHTASSALTFARLLPWAPSRRHLPCFLLHA